MLATLTDNAFDDEQWDFEVKWDGYRTIAFLNKGSIDLQSRNGHSFNKKFYTIFTSLQAWDVNAVVDGEIVAVDENKMPNFSKLQNWKGSKQGELIYYVFDITGLEGYDLTNLPFSERKKILIAIIPELSDIKSVSYTHLTLPTSDLV